MDKADVTPTQRLVIDGVRDVLNGPGASLESAELIAILCQFVGQCIPSAAMLYGAHEINETVRANTQAGINTAMETAGSA